MSVFRRTADRYGSSAPVDTPYRRASQEWDRRIGEPVIQARNWRAMAFAGWGVAALAVGGLIYQGATRQIATYIVPIDRYGQPGRIELAGRAYVPTTAEMGYFLADWVSRTRSKSIDPIVIRDNWTMAYHFVVGAAIGQLNDFAKTHDPFANAGQQAVSVEVVSVLQRSANTYQVQWRETTYDRGATTSTLNWTGLFTTKIQPPTNEAELRANPLGVYITEFQWSRDL
jgi:type IV secretory pathway TrbF-like protein